MREIKFRGMTEMGTWLYGDLYTFGNSTCISETNCGYDHPEPNNVIPETVGQYTGKIDKNGVEVYEGDIIKHIDYDGEVVGEVKYVPCMFLAFENTKDYFGYTIDGVDKVEVIGNIHERNN